MITTVVLLSMLGSIPGKADGLTLSATQLTYGILGPVRREASLLPGDSLYLSFTIEGLSADPSGKVLYHMTTEVADASGKVMFKPPVPRDLEAINALGGNSLPAYARIDVGLEQSPGEYTALIVVTDRTTKKTASLKQAFTVLPKAFGAVRLSVTKDAERMIPAGLLGPGESVWVNTVVVGFARGESKPKQPNITFELRILGSDGKPTVAKPFAGAVDKDVEVSAQGVPVQFLLPLNRAGQFTVEVTATDVLTGKKSVLTFPLVVQTPAR